MCVCVWERGLVSLFVHVSSQSIADFLVCLSTLGTCVLCVLHAILAVYLSFYELGSGPKGASTSVWRGVSLECSGTAGACDPSTF